MGRAPKLSESQKESMYTQYCLGESVADLAGSYGIGKSTAQRYISDMRRRRESEGNMSHHECIVAGDKKNGRLLSSADPHLYKGTCVIRGKAHSKTFTTVNAKKAEEMWRKWCEELRDEQAFMDMVERKEPEEDVTPEADPWRDVAEEQATRIEELEAEVAELREQNAQLKVEVVAAQNDAANEKAVRANPVVEDTEQQEPKLASWFNSNGAFHVVWDEKPIYLIWAKGEQPRCYGVYQRSESALRDIDKLNDVAAFLGNGNAFEIEEVAWK